MTKYLLSSLLILAVLVGGVGYAEAYDGKIKGVSDDRGSIEGDIITVSGYIIRADPIPDEKVQISFVDRLTEKTILIVETEIQFPSVIVTDDEYWTFEYSFDSSDTVLEPDTMYDVTFQYDDKTDITGVEFNSPPAQQAVMAGELLASQSEAPREIPSWVKDIFKFYSDGQISDDELLNAIEYLVSVELIKIK